jgi:4-amino-4-deoxy-L-arabinose transferase-like glycosyltransferase
MNYHRVSFVAMLIAATFLALIGLGKPAFLDYDEAIYAKVLHDSIENGDLLSLTKDGKPWFDKPSLYFFLMAASTAVFGETEFALRLPGSLFMIFAILLTWLIAYEMTHNDILASSAAFVLLTTTIFIFGGRQVRFDVPATVMTLFAFYSFLKGQSGSPWWYLGMGAGAAGAFFFRSILGLLVFPYIGIYAFFTRRWQWLKNSFFWLGTLAMAGILIPWFIYQTYILGTQFWTEHILGHILGRYVNPIIGTQESFYYTKKILILIEPWTLIFIVAALFSFFYKSLNASCKSASNAFFAITLFTLFLFGASTSKLFYYIFPMIPFAALFIALTGVPLLRHFWKAFPKTAALSMSFFLAGAVSLTIIQIFFPPEEDTLLLPLSSYTQRFAEEEKIIGTLIRSSDLPVYLYGEFPLRDTLHYYSGGIPLIAANSETEFQLPNLLILPAHASLKDANTHLLHKEEFLALYRVEK